MTDVVVAFTTTRENRLPQPQVPAAGCCHCPFSLPPSFSIVVSGRRPFATIQLAIHLTKKQPTFAYERSGAVICIQLKVCLLSLMSNPGQHGIHLKTARASSKAIIHSFAVP